MMLVEVTSPGADFRHASGVCLSHQLLAKNSSPIRLAPNFPELQKDLFGSMSLGGLNCSVFTVCGFRPSARAPRLEIRGPSVGPGFPELREQLEIMRAWNCSAVCSAVSN